MIGLDLFDETEEAVVLSPSGRKKKRKPDTYARNVAKKARHSGGIPSIACCHNTAKVCLAATLSPEEIAGIHRVLYATSDKVKQDAILLSYMDITTVKRRRLKVDDSGKQKNRDLTVKYSVLRDKGEKEDKEKIPVCKASFMSLLCEYLTSLMWLCLGG